jgi:hypothetical protein
VAGAVVKQKTHDRFQPWVLVEIQTIDDKRQRRRVLRRRPEQLVAGFLTSRKLYRLYPRTVKPDFEFSRRSMIGRTWPKKESRMETGLILRADLAHRQQWVYQASQSR